MSVLHRRIDVKVCSLVGESLEDAVDTAFRHTAITVEVIALSQVGPPRFQAQKWLTKGRYPSSESAPPI